MILILDNYDSFTYNLAQMVGRAGYEPWVVRSDRITLDEIDAAAPSHLIVSPGPGEPQDAGLSVVAIRRFAGRIPILGVCLGHQAIAVAFGGLLGRAEPVHGKTDLIHHDSTGLFRGLPQPFEATRYHSLIVREETLPAPLAVTARTADGLIMALAHRRLPVFGVQFHPESVLTPAGPVLLDNFLRIGSRAAAGPRPALSRSGSC